MGRGTFTRKDLVGGRYDVLVWIIGVIGSVALFMYGLFGFQWLNQRDPDFVRILAVAYSVSLGVILAARKRFFPWWQKAPALGAASAVALAVVFGFVVVGGVLVANGILDSGPPLARRYVIVGRMDGADFILAPISSNSPQRVDLHVGRRGRSLEPGNVVELAIRPGLFRKAWISDYRLVRYK